MFTLFNSAYTFGSILIFLISYIMALCVAISFHEFAHAIAASSQGDYTAKALKRCTLAPLSHMDIWGTLSLFLLGFGWAKPVPVDPRNFKNGKKSHFLVAISGIVTNLILGTLFLFILILLIKIFPNVYNIKGYGPILYNFLSISISLNFRLAFFNLLPICPLDGFKLVETFSRFDSKFVQFMKKYSNIIYFIFLILGLYSYYFYYTADQVINFLIKLFSKILGVGV